MSSVTHPPSFHPSPAPPTLCVVRKFDQARVQTLLLSLWFELYIHKTKGRRWGQEKWREAILKRSGQSLSFSTPTLSRVQHSCARVLDSTQLCLTSYTRAQRKRRTQGWTSLYIYIYSGTSHWEAVDRWSVLLT